MIVRLFFYVLLLATASTSSFSQQTVKTVADPEVVTCLHGLGSAASLYATALTRCAKAKVCRDLSNAYLLVLQKARYLYDANRRNCVEGIDSTIKHFAEGTDSYIKIITYAIRAESSPQAAQTVAKEVEEELRRLAFGR